MYKLGYEHSDGKTKKSTAKEAPSADHLYKMRLAFQQQSLGTSMPKMQTTSQTTKRSETTETATNAKTATATAPTKTTNTTSANEQSIKHRQSNVEDSSPIEARSEYSDSDTEVIDDVTRPCGYIWAKGGPIKH